MAVSYTHLDVYKRQALNMTWLGTLDLCGLKVRLIIVVIVYASILVLEARVLPILFV